MLGKGDEVLLSTLEEFKQKKALNFDLKDNELKNVLTIAEIIELLKTLNVKQIFLFKDEKLEITISRKSPHFSVISSTGK